MLSGNWKHVQLVKIYMPCNFEVNMITRLGVIALFSLYFFFFLKNVIKTNAHKSDIKLEAQPTEPVSLTWQ
jgi:hypothetical protein